MIGTDLLVLLQMVNFRVLKDSPKKGNIVWDRNINEHLS